MKNVKKLFLLAVMFLSTSFAFAQSQDFITPATSNLKGIWQMHFYVSGSADIPGSLRAGNTFKILSEDGYVTNFTVVPNKGAIITGFGTYKQLSDHQYTEYMIRNIHMPELNGTEYTMEYELKDNGTLIVLKFHVNKDKYGNVLDTWYYETWKRVEMPAEFPEDLVR
jgi:hypothetical protein